MPVKDVLERGGPRKLLALDGGGIRGLITIEVLGEIEDQLRGDRGEEFRLSDEFDYIVGTSTGAVIATCLALGMRVTEIRAFTATAAPRCSTRRVSCAASARSSRTSSWPSSSKRSSARTPLWERTC